MGRHDSADTGGRSRLARRPDGVPARGRFLVRAGAHETLEGGWRPARLVVLEFPNLEQARRWYDSEDYREPKALRMKSALTDAVLVEGV